MEKGVANQLHNHFGKWGGINALIDVHNIMYQSSKLLII